MNILELITSKLNEFTESEALVAKNVLEFPTIIVEHNITDLAEKLGVSRNTITRFCKKIGYHGFTDFSYSMDEFLDKSMEEQSISLKTVDYMVHSYANTTLKILDCMSENDFKNIAALIKNHKSIKVIGTGKSSSAALQMKYRFQSVMRDIQIVEDIYVFKDITYIYDPDDLVFFFTTGGKSRITNASVDAAIKMGAETICFTMSKTLDKAFKHIYRLPQVKNSNGTIAYDSQSIFMIIIDIILGYYRQLI